MLATLLLAVGVPLLGLSLLALGDCALVSHESGSCEPYPSSGGFCSQLLGGRDVFVYAGGAAGATGASVAVLAETDVKMEAAFAPIKRIMMRHSSASCTTDYLALLCRSNFPPCDEAGVPQRSCKSFCSATMAATCAEPFFAFELNGQTRNLVDCEADIGDSATAQSVAYGDFFANWTGTAAFPEGPTYEEGAFGGRNETVSCLAEVAPAALICERRDCPEPTVFRQAALVDADSDYCRDPSTPPDCVKCNSACVAPCPTPLVFTDAEFAFLWALTWLPGLVSVPLNALILAVEVHRARNKRKKKMQNIGDHLIAIAAGFSLLLFFSDALPAAFLREDWRCGDPDSLEPPPEVELLPHCALGMLRVHVEQALMLTIFFTLLKIHGALSAAAHMKVHRLSARFRRLAFLGIFVLPATLATLTLTRQAGHGEEHSEELESDEFQDIHELHEHTAGSVPAEEFMNLPVNIRYALTCRPEFHTKAEELLLVELPMIAATLGCLVVSALLFRLVAKLNWASRSSQNQSTTSRSNGPGSRTEAARTNVRLAKAVMRFALASAFLVAANLGAMFSDIEHSQSFGIFISDWVDCALYGLHWDALNGSSHTGLLHDAVFYGTSLETVMRSCGDVREVAPKLSFIIFFIASSAMCPLVFAGSFCRPAFRYVAHARRTGGSAVNPAPLDNSSGKGTGIINTAPQDPGGHSDRHHSSNLAK